VEYGSLEVWRSRKIEQYVRGSRNIENSMVCIGFGSLKVESESQEVWKIVTYVWRSRNIESPEVRQNRKIFPEGQKY